MKNIIITMTFILLAGFSWRSMLGKKQPAWVSEVRQKVELLEKDFEGEFGIYIKDLSDNTDFSHKASQYWYLSSTVKIPVAVALLKLVDKNELKLNEKVTITKADYRDGAGPVNWIVPGQKVTYRYLLNKMLRYSDNAATDLIIKRVGLDAVNEVVSTHTGGHGFGPITTLLDVRKKAYSEFHPKAEKLNNMAYFRIKKKRGARLKQLAKELKIPKSQLKYQNMSEGFDQYYGKKWNSAILTSYARFYENIIRRKVLSSSSTKLLMGLLATLRTGKKRTKKGLSKDVVFAHKTGTQHRQACDMGVASKKTDKGKKAVMILVCTKKWKKLSEAEALMAEVGRIVTSTKLL